MFGIGHISIMSVKFFESNAQRRNTQSYPNDRPQRASLHGTVNSQQGTQKSAVMTFSQITKW
ncbi:Hypothetical protein CpCap5W_2036 [Corynebacterium pseudotuberculosis]|nr:hypothetical protein CPTC_01217 [Corynebacterium pseudotuberculosis]AQU91516.1 Hypothetical protein CpphoP_2001 [Corynebacterium pseudotuberculosis]AUY07940.1 Hypothetical protein CpOVI2C_01959 [Corynebacterium pseudotuberculosis]AUY57127.1 Hypothetical protein CpCAP3W_01957 [Corynebacterium pseudotuberculosis]QBB91958.1 Hypothetical protein CpCR07_2038 [Corynebacterium pseudotuberculosis]